ncbi:MAG: GspH/FimT family pseudopilin [Glaciecola sp.]|jgi:type IV fimbrial biogenesis protein FimT
MQRHIGLTLLELMIALSIVALTFIVVGPSAHHLYQNNVIISQLNSTSSVVQFARHHAIHTKHTTIICPTADFIDCDKDWNQHKMVFVDDNANHRLDHDERLLTTLTRSHNTVTTGPSTPIRFNFNGVSASPATIKICDLNATDRHARALFVSLQGRIKVSRDKDGDGIYETNSGRDLHCR